MTTTATLAHTGGPCPTSLAYFLGYFGTLLAITLISVVYTKLTARRDARQWAEARERMHAEAIRLIAPGYPQRTETED